ncbi:hypothetical protein AB3S75_034744 [Citrus x aurantiifolia]
MDGPVKERVDVNGLLSKENFKRAEARDEVVVKCNAKEELKSVLEYSSSKIKIKKLARQVRLFKSSASVRAGKKRSSESLDVVVEGAAKRVCIQSQGSENLILSTAVDGLRNGNVDVSNESGVVLQPYRSL